MFLSELFSRMEKSEWMKENSHVMLSVRFVCFDRRLLCGLSGSYTQRCPLRSEKDVCQQRPGPECLQERDHHHGENSLTL